MRRSEIRPFGGQADASFGVDLDRSELGIGAANTFPALRGSKELSTPHHGKAGARATAGFDLVYV